MSRSLQLWLVSGTFEQPMHEALSHSWLLVVGCLIVSAGRVTGVETRILPAMQREQVVSAVSTRQLSDALPVCNSLPQ